MTKVVINDAGARVLADAWLAGGFASNKQCVTSPDTAQGQTMRAAGSAFDEMLAVAGAVPTSSDFRDSMSQSATYSTASRNSVIAGCIRVMDTLAIVTAVFAAILLALGVLVVVQMVGKRLFR